ncbi:putative ABC transporter permease [Anaerococcus tetradius]|uniref:putative ABC transporter permease n=1 Tax=Anaerococcus tetradius TaxID=33036 RepID=UPI0023F1EBF9|nr:hypothetical protein [Anaerococcus tetradius]
MDFVYYLTYFFVYAFIGWILEVFYKAMTRGIFVNSGFLNGPYCPVYGFGAIGVLYFLSLVETNNKLLLFFSSMFIATLVEYLTGFILEKLFHMKWWDYSDKLLNLRGYICLEFSLMWGALCFILHEAVHPLLVHFISHFTCRFLLGADIVFSLVLIVDCLATINTLLGINKKFKEIERSSEKIKEVSDRIGERVAKRSLDLKDKKEEFEKSKLALEIDEKEVKIKEDLRRVFEKKSERRILKAFPNLLGRIEERLRKE